MGTILAYQAELPGGLCWPRGDDPPGTPRCRGALDAAFPPRSSLRSSLVSPGGIAPRLALEGGDGAFYVVAWNAFEHRDAAVRLLDRRREPGGPGVLPHDHHRGRRGLEAARDICQVGLAEQVE